MFKICEKKNWCSVPQFCLSFLSTAHNIKPKFIWQRHKGRRRYWVGEREWLWSQPSTEPYSSEHEGYMSSYYRSVRLWSHRERNGPHRILRESHSQSFKISTRIELLLSISLIKLQHSLTTSSTPTQAGWKETMFCFLWICLGWITIGSLQRHQHCDHKLKRWFYFWLSCQVWYSLFPFSLFWEL